MSSNENRLSQRRKLNQSQQDLVKDDNDMEIDIDIPVSNSIIAFTVPPEESQRKAAEQVKQQLQQVTSDHEHEFYERIIDWIKHQVFERSHFVNGYDPNLQRIINRVLKDNEGTKHLTIATWFDECRSEEQNTEMEARIDTVARVCVTLHMNKKLQGKN